MHPQEFHSSHRVLAPLSIIIFYSLNKCVSSPFHVPGPDLALPSPEEYPYCTQHGLQTRMQICAPLCPTLSVPLLTPNNWGPIPTPAVHPLMQRLFRTPLTAAVPPKAVLWPVPGSRGGGGAAKAHRVGEGKREGEARGRRGDVGGGEGGCPAQERGRWNREGRGRVRTLGPQLPQSRAGSDSRGGERTR